MQPAPLPRPAQDRPALASPLLAWQVLTAGICALVLTVGLARFAYTPILPLMKAQAGLNDAASGWLATLNYAGYMAGTLYAAVLHDARRRLLLYRLALIVAVLSTAAMGLTVNPWLWGALRFLGGLTSVAGMLLGSGMVLAWLVEHGHRPELGIHFAGMGLGLAISGVAASWMAGSLDWSSQWLALGAFGLVLLLPAWIWMPAALQPRATPTPAAPPLQPAVKGGLAIGDLLLPVAYFCAGVGYVVTATFLVAALAQRPDVGGSGNLVWIVAGLAATPSVWLWDRVARGTGQLGALQLAYLVQIASFVVLLFGPGLIGALLGAILYGATFMGIVGLTLAYAGRQALANPARAMARLTLSYGLGQTAAPAVAGWLVARTGGYQAPLILAGLTMAAGIVLLMLLARQPARRPHA
ncbi:YbfB/YjiJ family MFS transporter [Xanthobacter sp. ZOL 2024]